MVSGLQKRCKCKVCGVENENHCYQVKEMLLGTKEVFEYFECGACQCMQIMNIPGDMGRYYGSGYYSFENQELPQIEFSENRNSDKRILDVGCGSGAWLIEKAKEGYGYLYGCDPFIEQDIQYGERIVIKKCSIQEMEGTFDIINFGDSFEHMAEPLEVLRAVKRLLSADGICQINIPVYPNVAVETFETNWYQWDAPRHFFLHSRKSMEYLCKQAELSIEQVEYNSDIGQFVISYLYELGIPMSQIPDNAGGVFPQEDLRKFQEYTDYANKNLAGDHAVFVLCHK